MANGLHLLKLVMGVDISTRPVRKSGRDGKPRKSSIRNAAAALKTRSFRLSMTISENC